MASVRPFRVLYSFPHRLGADRICYTAWQQVNGLAKAGAELRVFPASSKRAVPDGVNLTQTLAYGPVRLPYKVIGSRRAFALHDHIVAKRLEKLAGTIDIIHLWSQGALQTIKTAARLGIPTALERPNAHTRFAYEVVEQECRRLGVALPANHEHAYNAANLQLEEAEFEQADYLLCPSDFVVQTYLDLGFKPEKLVRHIYGYDPQTYYPSPQPRPERQGLRMLFVGVCAVRKGLHFALDAWLNSPAHSYGEFLIAGGFLPDYHAKLRVQLAHPSVKVLGHRTDVADLMRSSDMLVLPSIEEGFGLVCTEAMGSGCVPLVSTACTDLCRHMENALVHPVADVDCLTRHITQLHENRDLLAQLRNAGLAFAPSITWDAAGKKLIEAYQKMVDDLKKN